MLGTYISRLESQGARILKVVAVSTDYVVDYQLGADVYHTILYSDGRALALDVCTLSTWVYRERSLRGRH